MVKISDSVVLAQQRLYQQELPQSLCYVQREN